MVKHRGIGALLLYVLLVGLPPIAAQGYQGAAALFSLERVTVVYPESAGEAGRVSAERRAAYLESKHDIEATVVADATVDAERLGRDLLLLGWDNRVLSKLATGPPWALQDGARVFLDGIPVGADEDLMFTVPSPFADGRRLVFWSRIDPELDRYLVLPFVGSDWAVLRGYTLVRQGMFHAGMAWPPRRNLDAERSRGTDFSTLTSSRSGKRVTLHYDPQKLPEDEVARLLKIRERALGAAIGMLGDPGDQYRMDLYVYDDLAVKKAETDVADAIHSIPRNAELHMTRRHALSPSPHEEVHLVARALWGPCYHTSLFEGLAIALESSPDDAELPLFGAWLLDQQTVPSLSALLDEERLRSLSAVAFPASGLFVQWLMERGELSLVRRVYPMLELDADSLAQELGLAPREADDAFAAWLASRATSVAPEYDFRKAHGLARQHAQNGQWDPAVTQLERALKIKPQDPETRYRLASAQRAAGRAEDAEKTLKALLGLDLGAETERYAILGHLELGLVLEAQGRTEAARKAYRRVLDYPDHNGSHGKARTALGSPAGDAGGGGDGGG